jgi:hypothetical protein
MSYGEVHTSDRDVGSSEREGSAKSGQGCRLIGRRLWRVEDLASLPNADWLVEGILERDVTASVYGPSGSGKSFLMADLGMSVASGIGFHGARAQEGAVVYVAAEGFRGLGKRIEAWKTEHHVANMPFFVLDGAVHMLATDDVSAFIEHVNEAAIRPVLVIIDTLSRSFTGGDENSQRDMSLFVASADRIRREFGATVVVVHHTGKDGRQERGSSVLRCDFDVMIAVRGSKKGDSVTMSSSKARDSEGFEARTYTLVSVADSKVLRSALTEQQAKALAALALDDAGLGFAAWGRTSRVVDSTLSRAKDQLLTLGYVRNEATTGRYLLTSSGRTWLGLPSLSEVFEAAPESAASSVSMAPSDEALSFSRSPLHAMSESERNVESLSHAAAPYRAAARKTPHPRHRTAARVRRTNARTLDASLPEAAA